VSLGISRFNIYTITAYIEITNIRVMTFKDDKEKRMFNVK